MYSSMTLWIGFALMTAAAVLAVLWPLARRSGVIRSGSDIVVYRDQLDEIERDSAAGLIGDKEAAAAKAEVSRRLLAAAEAVEPRPAQSAPTALWRRRAVAVVALVALPAGAIAFYLMLGSPFMPDQPLALRLAAARENQSIEALVTQVEGHLERNPNEGRGWEVIAPIYLRLGRYDDAVKARRNALRLNGETPARRTALGEALVFAANGVVTAEAKGMFERAVELDSNEVQGRYFLGLAAEQDGDRTLASAIWRGMLEGAPAGAPWREFVRQALARVDPAAAQRLGAGEPSAPASGPTDEQVAAAADLAPEQRTAMVRDMVGRLAERLHREGSDVEGWLRLIRSYMILGEPDKARAAVGDAKRALADNPASLARLQELAKGLGLEG